MSKTIILLAATGALTLGVAACGGSAAHPASAANTAPATTSTAGPASTGGGAASSKLSISAAKSGSLMFSTRTLTAKAGTVRITFTNDSPEDHNFTLVRSDGSQVAATPTFDGGSKILMVHLVAGTYTYYCSVPGHRQAGMQGTLTVS